MRFRAKFLQPKVKTSTQPGATLMHIPDVFRTHDGRIEGEDEAMRKALDHKDAVTGQLPGDDALGPNERGLLR